MLETKELFYNDSFARHVFYKQAYIGVRALYLAPAKLYKEF